MSYNILHFTLEYSDKVGAYQFLTRLDQGLRPYGVKQLSVIGRSQPDDLKMNIPANVFFLDKITINQLKSMVNKQTVFVFHETMTSYVSGNSEIPVSFFELSRGYKRVRMIHDYSTAICPQFLNYNLYQYCQGSMSEACVESKCISSYIYSSFLKQIRSLNEYDGIFYLSDHTKKRMISLGVNQNIMLKVPPLIEGSFPAKMQRNKKRHILYASRINQQKGLLYLIMALGSLKQYDWKLIIAGEAEDRSYSLGVFRLAVKMGIMNRIEVLGFVDQRRMKELYWQSDFMCFPSICHETYGFSGAEAVLHGTPVVAFDVEGVKEWLEPYETGLLCNVKDVDMMRKHIEELLADDKYLLNLAEHCRLKSRMNSLENQLQILHRYFCSITGGMVE